MIWIGSVRYGFGIGPIWIGLTVMDSVASNYGSALSEWTLRMAKRARTSKMPFYTGSARFSPGDSSIVSDYLAKSLGETVHFLRSAHHGYGIAIAHFPLGDSQNSHLQWTNSLGETLHFSCRKVMFHLVYCTGCNPKPCTKSILTACTS